MKCGIARAVLAIVCLLPSLSFSQQKSPVTAPQLDLSVETATTTDDGKPSSFRITLKNVGSITVDLPMPEANCVVGGGGIEIRSLWYSGDPATGSLGISAGTGCGMDHFPSLQYRVQNQWIRLRPGESVVVSASVRREFISAEKGNLELWAEYTPPELKDGERAELQEGGMLAPMKNIESEHQTYPIY